MKLCLGGMKLLVAKKANGTNTRSHEILMHETNNQSHEILMNRTNIIGFPGTFRVSGDV